VQVDTAGGNDRSGGAEWNDRMGLGTDADAARGFAIADNEANAATFTIWIHNTTVANS
jgi:hypothetical protein